jgi:predicted transcriptional regulator
MPEQTVTFSVDAGLHNAFAGVAAKNSCDSTELLKAFMDEYVRQDAGKQQYEEWFRSKVEAGLKEFAEGKAIPHEAANAQVEAFASSMRSNRQKEIVL